MSARAPVGASSRPELFNAQRADSKSGTAIEEKGSDADAALADEELHGRYGLSDYGEKSPLQLEHMIGFAGNYRNTVQMSPINDTMYIRR